jgi:hypothetical protein
MIAVSIDREAAAVLNIENLFTSVYQARENAQIEIDLQNQKMAVESVSAAEVLIQRFACYTTTLHIFSFFYQRWDNKARRKFASDSLISTYIHHTYIHIYIHIYIYTYVHTRTLHVTLSVRAHIYMDFPLYVYSLFILPLHWPLHPSRRFPYSFPLPAQFNDSTVCPIETATNRAFVRFRRALCFTSSA